MMSYNRMVSVRVIEMERAKEYDIKKKKRNESLK